MQIYLVGGAVRDQLLQLPVKEKDWVVVGGTPEIMLKKGFKQVGKHFPVFLHPDTQEEYALARQEMKHGHGYQGFVFHFSKEVSLEEDLKRRDLSINAMAMDDKGQIIDPYGGQLDLKNKILRHVSPAFIEDPLRVLRTARFHARFFHLGFHIHPDTLMLMKKLVASNELSYLSQERIWKEWEKALSTPNPEVFFEDLKICGALPSEIASLSTQKLQEAALQTPDIDIRLTIFLMELSNLKILHDLKIPLDLQKQIQLFQNFHQELHLFQHPNAQSILSLLQKTDAFRKTTLFKRLLECYAVYAPQYKSLNLTEHWLELLQQLKSIQLPKDMQNQKNVANIQHYFETKRLEMIEEKVFSHDK